MIRFKQAAIILILPSYAMAAEYHEIENPNNNKGVTTLEDTWVVKYQTDDFTDEVEQATLLYIPKNYQTEKAFFLRCKDYFMNFSVQYIDNEKNLKEPGEDLANASASFAKHGYVYDDKQTLKVSTPQDSDRFEISVGGQNRNLSPLFKTNIEKQPGMLGMSFHYSFTYKEMPDFKSDENNSDTTDFFNLLKPALIHNHNIQFKLENDTGHQQTFTLDVQRSSKFVPQEVIQYCITGRELR